MVDARSMSDSDVITYPVVQLRVAERWRFVLAQYMNRNDFTLPRLVKAAKDHNLDYNSASVFRGRDFVGAKLYAGLGQIVFLGTFRRAGRSVCVQVEEWDPEYISKATADALAAAVLNGALQTRWNRAKEHYETDVVNEFFGID